MQKQNVVVGNLVYSLVLGMSVPDVSGAAVANLEVESLKHAKPTFHGDTIYAVTRVLDRKETSDGKRGIVTVEIQGHQPARGGGLLLQAPADGVEAGVRPGPPVPLRRGGLRRGLTGADRWTYLSATCMVQGMAGRIRDAARGFDANAGAYEVARPSYPAEAVAHIVGHGGHRPRHPGARPGRRHGQAHPPAGPHRGRGGGGRAGGRHAGPARRAPARRRGPRRYGRGAAAGRRLGRRGHRGPGLPLVRRAGGAGRVAPRAAPGRPPVPGVEHPGPRRRLGAGRSATCSSTGPAWSGPTTATTTSTTQPWWPSPAGSPRSSCGPTPGSSRATPTCWWPGPSR